MKRFAFVIIAALALTVTLVPSALADDSSLALGSSQVQRGDIDSYVVIMKADPLVTTYGDNVNSAKAKAQGAKLKAGHKSALKGAGISSNRVTNEYVTALNGFSARITYSQATKLAANKDVALVLPDQLRHPQTDSSGSFLGLDSAGGSWKTGYTGKGVVVGIIDTGIWPEHPSFADKGLPAPPTGPLPCEFGNTGGNFINPGDASFTCNHKLIGARQMLDTYRLFQSPDPDEFDSARDDEGHGTHTASTAAGDAGVQAVVLGANVGAGKLSGMAPDAHIIAYKALGNLGGYTSDLAAAIDQAVADGVDVINYSIGGGGGVLGADDIAFMFAADAGVFVAASAGNNGPGAHTIGSPGDNPWLTTVGASTQSRFFQGTVKLGNGASYTGASITGGTGVAPLVDGAALGNDQCFSTTTFSASITGKIVLCRRGGNNRIDKSYAVMDQGGVGMIMYENSDAGNLFTDSHFVPSVHVDNTPGLAIKAYITSAGAGATAQITDTRKLTTWPYAPSMTEFSSRGPNNYADIIKPDVTAPGLQILAGASPVSDEGFPQGELFQAIAGTSMSSPHVAGLFALIKQAHPDWSAAEAKSALMTTASQNVLDNDRSSQADPFDMGSGHVNPGKPNQKGSAFQPGLAYDAGLFQYAAWTCAINAGVFSAGTCAFLDSVGEDVSDPSNLNYPSIAVADVPGQSVVTRTVTSVAQENGNRTYHASVQAPPGYSVSVSPSSFTLKKGQSVSFDVTITNNSAPVGAWRFGSLTWKDQTGNYSVRSPIAVKGSQFDAPPLVEGSGESGSADIPVKFGYTGTYTATAEGLVAATVTSDNVLQDADQTFSPSDVGSGGANAHVFNLSGVEDFRIAMPPDATEANADLDIYVYNPSNALVASSTSGGTDELVNIVNPVDGAWTVYVHGWSTPGGDSDYDLYTWEIPDTGGGSLSIGSSPASAVTGTTGTVTVSWTGATASQWWFGAVSHVGPGSTVMGRTLFEVDNR